MRLFGREIAFRQKAAPMLSTVDRGWWQTIIDLWPGAWQQHNEEWSQDTVLAYHAVYSCITLIANDIGKLRPKLVEYSERDKIWIEATSPAFSPVLRKPNNYQNHIQFKEWWISSKLVHGNTYALKVRDNRGIVVGMYLLDPTRVKPLVTPSAEVYYEINQDNMANVQEQLIIPASDIIHDRMNCIFHPLVGVSPIFACGAAANTGLKITNSSSKFFSNNANPGGVLTAPGSIGDATAQRLKDYWQTSFSGDSAGKIAVLGDGLKFEPMRMTAVDAQLIEQLKWTADVVCSTYHVPPFKIGLGVMPTQNAEVLNQIYYSDVLQSLIEQFELCMDEGLNLDTPTNGRMLGVKLDLEGLWRMDSATRTKTLVDAVAGGIKAPNEARQCLDLPPLQGGDSIYLQQQYYSLEALAKRDANDPFAKPEAPQALPALPPPDDSEDKAFLMAITKGLNEWSVAA